jgi:MFS family permease
MRQAHPVRNLRLLFAYWFLCDFQLWIPVWVVFLTLQRGFSLTQVTTAEGCFLIGVLVLEVPTGAVADRYGRSVSMGLGALALGLAILIFAFTASFAVLMASFLIWSVASALMSGADRALLYDTLRVAGREAEYERFAGRGMAVRMAGVGLATLLGGPVAAVFDIRTTIFIGAATCVLTAGCAFAIWEPPRREHDAPHEPYLRTIRGAFNEAWRLPDVRLLILFAGTGFATLEGLNYLIQPYLVDRGVAVGVTFSLLQALIFLAGLFGAMAAERLGSAGSAARTLLAAPAMAVVCFAVLAAAPGLTGFGAFVLVFALSACLEPIAAGYVNRRVGSERRATVLSIQNMARSLVMAVLAPGLGFTTDHFGLPHAFALEAVCGTLAVILVGIPLWTRINREHSAPPFELEPDATPAA